MRLSRYGHIRFFARESLHGRSITCHRHGERLVPGSDEQHNRPRRFGGRGEIKLQRQPEIARAENTSWLSRLKQWHPPGADRSEYRSKRFSAFRQVKQSRCNRRGRVLTKDDPVLIQLSEAIAEQVARDTGKSVLQIREATPAGGHQFADDEERPSITYKVEGEGYGALLSVRLHKRQIRGCDIFCQLLT